jgi:hypothetical protein
MAIDSFKHRPSPDGLDTLHESLRSSVERMKAEDAAKVCAQAARVISEAREKASDGLDPGPRRAGSRDLLRVLVSLAGWMEAHEANRLCREVVRTLLKKSVPMDQTIVGSLPQLDTAIASELA